MVKIAEVMKKLFLLLMILCLGGCGNWRDDPVSRGVGNVSVTTATQILEGKESGVLFNSSSGNPEVSPSLLIRGIGPINAGTEPLYVVDGMVYNGPINMINPSDIETIKVLKDPAETSIYGMRGGNGVVVITTKKGKGK